MANAEHWVPLMTVASFKRMSNFSSFKLEWLATVLRSSKELEVDSEGKNIRRRHELHEPTGRFERSIYAVNTIFFPPSLVDYFILVYYRKVSERKTLVSCMSWRDISGSMVKLIRCECAATTRRRSSKSVERCSQSG